MTPDEITEIENALDEGFGEIAGDEMLWVDKDDNQTALIGMLEDLEDGSVEGVSSGPAGWKVIKRKKFTSLKRYLAERGVSFDPSGHAIIDGERWDLAEGAPMLDSMVPLCGIQNLVQIVLRRAVELNNTVAGSDFTYG